MARLSRSRPLFALMTDDDRLPDPAPLLRCLPPGAWVIHRNYRASARDRQAFRLAALCRARRLVLLVGNDLGLAIRLRCGLHLPEGAARRLSPRVRLWHGKSGRVLCIAAHSRIALARAFGADAALLSPVFPTASHPDAKPLGLFRLRALVQEAGLPVLALGGVTGRTARLLGGSGIAGIATVGGLAAGLDPRRSVYAKDILPGIRRR